MFSDLTLVGATICSRVILEDKNVGANGVRASNTTVSVTSTTITRN